MRLFLSLTAIALVGINIMATTPATAASERVNIIGATSDPATSAYAYLSTLGAMCNKHAKKISVTATPTRGFIDAGRWLRDGKADFIAVISFVAYQMHEGLHGEKVWKDARLLLYTYPAVPHAVTRQDTNIYSFADLKGKTVGIAQPGNISTILCEAIYRAVGYDVKKDMKLLYLAVADLHAGLRDRTLDFIMYHPGIPAPAFTEEATLTNLRWIGMTDEHIAALDKITSGVNVPYTIPAGTYPKQDKNIKMVAAPAALIASSRMSNEVAYDLVKTFVSNLEEAGKRLDMIKRNTVPSLFNRPAPSWMPYHPGAEKALKELGYLK